MDEIIEVKSVKSESYHKVQEVKKLFCIFHWEINTLGYFFFISMFNNLHQNSVEEDSQRKQKPLVKIDKTTTTMRTQNPCLFYCKEATLDKQQLTTGTRITKITEFKIHQITPTVIRVI